MAGRGRPFDTNGQVINSTPQNPTFRWDRLGVATGLSYCLLVGGLSVGVVLGELREQFSMSGIVAALHGSTFGFALLIVGTLGVALSDRLGRRRVLWTSSVSMTVGVAMLCLGGSWPITLAGTAVAGFGAALLVMIVPGLVSDHYGDARAAAFAAINGPPGIAALIYSLAIAAALALDKSWRVPYLGLMLIFAGVLAIVALPVELPGESRQGKFSLGHLRQRDVLVPWLFIINAVLAEFTVGVWTVTYLKEVGGASPGLAPLLGGCFAIGMAVSRLWMRHVIAVFGAATVSFGFIGLSIGALMLCFMPNLALKALGVLVMGFSAGPLYPLTVDGLYLRASSRVDSVSLGAFCALASGVAISIGPLMLGILADSVGLRWAILFVPVLALSGAVIQRPPAVAYRRAARTPTAKVNS